MVWRLCAKASPSSTSVLLMAASARPSRLRELDNDDAAAASWRGLDGSMEGQLRKSYQVPYTLALSCLL